MRNARQATHGGEPLTVSAILAYRWYDEIEPGRKRTEYRGICDYWTHLLWDGGRRDAVKRIKFSRGYTQRKMIFSVKRIDRNTREGVYEIHLGNWVAD